MPGLALDLSRMMLAAALGLCLGYGTDAGEVRYALLLLMLGVCFYKYKSLMLGLVLICSWALMINYSVVGDKSTDSAPRDLKLVGHVVGLPMFEPNVTRFDFELAEPHEGYSRIRLRWYEGPELVPGQRWELDVRIRRPRNYANPGSLDYRRQLAAQGIGFTGYVRSAVPLEHDSGGLDPWRYRVRAQLQQALDPDAAAWVSALLLGDRSLLHPDQWSWLARTGTTHLFVVSGMHIGLMAVVGGLAGRVLFSLLTFFALGRRTWCISVGAIGLATAYAFITGFDVPAQRALLMLWLALIAWLMGFRPGRWRLLALVFMVVLCIEPLVVGRVGFWLSFIAVAALMAAAGQGAHRQVWLRELVRAQGAVFCALLPVLLYAGFPVALAAPVINIFLIPLIALLILPALMISLLAGELIASPLWHYWQEPLAVFSDGLRALAEFDAVLYPTGQGALALGAGLLAALLLLTGGRMLRPAALALMLPLLWPAVARVPEGVVRIQMIDVGQGLSILVQTHRHSLLFDTGDRYGRFVLGRAVVEPYLRQQGLRELDLMVLSHQDRDHVGGADHLSRAFSPRHVVDGWSEGASCHTYPDWQWDGVRFRFLPQQGRFSEDNNRSCVLQIDAGHQRALLAADIGAKREQELVRLYGADLDVDLLQVAHHGSISSSNEAFLQATSPALYWISAGAGNRYGHPHPAVVERLRHQGGVIRSTAVHGALTAELGSGDRMVHSAYLEETVFEDRAQRSADSAAPASGIMAILLNL